MVRLCIVELADRLEKQRILPIWVNFAHNVGSLLTLSLWKLLRASAEQLQSDIVENPGMCWSLELATYGHLSLIIISPVSNSLLASSCILVQHSDHSPFLCYFVKSTSMNPLASP